MAKTETETAKKAAPKETKEEKKQKDALKEAQKQVHELTDQVKKEKDDYLRLMAEFETFRRRSAEEKLNLIGTAAEDTIKGLLPVLDDCERAMELLSKSSDEAAKEGTALIYNKLMDYLKTRGLEIIDAKDKKFDVDFHEAVTTIPAPTEEDKNHIMDEIQKGYKLNDKVIRYAKVVIYQ